MNAAHILADAFCRTAQRKRMVVLYWFTQTLCAAVAALPALGFVIPHSSHSLYGGEMLRHFDMMYLAELMDAARSSMLGLAALPVLLAVALSLLAAVFLSGGAVTLLVSDNEPYTPAAFWHGCGRNFWRFLRLALYSLFFYAIALSVNGALSKAIDKAWGKGMVEAPIVHANWARQALLLLLFLFISMAMDFAKVRLVAGDSRRSLRACFGSFGFALRRAASVLPVWLALGLALALSTALYVAIANRIEAPTMGAIAALFVIQQVYVLARVWLRMMSWGSAAAFEALQTAPDLAAPVAAVEDYSI